MKLDIEVDEVQIPIVREVLVYIRSQTFPIKKDRFSDRFL